MKQILCFAVLIVMFFYKTFFPQSNTDTIKSDTRAISTKSDNLSRHFTEQTLSRPFQIELSNSNAVFPINFKLYQNFLFDESIIQKNGHLLYEKIIGMTDSELNAFYKNKEQADKLLRDIYGEDLIDLKKILSMLGISKSQIIAVAAILKFLFYHPFGI